MRAWCRSELSSVAALPLALLFLASAAGAEEERARHPGYVDGSGFAELAGEDGKLVEVSLHGPLLRQVAKALTGRDKAIGGFLEGMVSITAVVVEDPRGSEAETREKMKALADRMDRAKWERIARVRESGEDVWVFVLYDGDGESLSGLTVLVSGSDELVFVNLAGRIDLGLIGDFAAKSEIPGLGDLLDEDITRSLREYEANKSRGDDGEKSKSKDSHKKSKDGRSEGAR